MKRKIEELDFRRGLETTGLEDGLERPAWVSFQNVRTNEGGAKRRAGTQRVLVLSTPHTAFAFNGTSEKVTIPLDTDIHALGDEWTFESLVKPTGVSGTQTVVAIGSTTSALKVYLDGTTFKALVTYSDSSTVTLSGGTAVAGTVYAIQVNRDKGVSSDTITLSVNGTVLDNTTTTKATKTPVGDPTVGSKASADWFGGTIDFVRLLSAAWTTQKNGLMRLPDPKVSYVLFDYSMEEANATTHRVDDRSAHRNHGTAVSGISAGTALTSVVAPVSVIHQYVGMDNRERILVGAGDSVYPVLLGGA